MNPQRGTKASGTMRAHMTRLLAGLATFLATAGPIAAQTPPAIVEYYHVDAVGSVRVVTDENRAVVRTHDYFAFGDGSAGTTAGQDPLRFTGKERDPETALDYFGARYYASRSGRFTSVDPVYTWSENLADPQRWNRYAYVRNNPVRYVDPDGRVIWAVVAAAAAAAILTPSEGSDDYGSAIFSAAATAVTEGVGSVISNLTRRAFFSMSGRAMTTAVTSTTQLEASVLKTFAGGQAKRVVLQEDLVVSRVFDKIPGVTGGRSSMAGNYFTTTRITSRAQAQRVLSLSDDFNQARFVGTAVIPKGTVTFQGRAARLGEIPGQGSQIYVPDISRITVSRVRPLR